MVLDQENKLEASFVTITDQAAEQVKAVIEQQQDQTGLFLRIFVQGGPGGVGYGMAIDMKKQPDDTEFTIQDLPVVVDRISYQYVDGATVDFDTTGEKKGFRISNPQAEELLAQMGGGCGSGGGSCCSTGDAQASGAGCGSGSGGCC